MPRGELTVLNFLAIWLYTMFGFNGAAFACFATTAIDDADGPMSVAKLGAGWLAPA